MMKVSRLLLSDFLGLMKLKGELQNYEILLDVRKDSISALTKSKDDSTIVFGRLNGQFEDLGNIAISDLVHFKRTVDTHSDTTLDLSINKNKLIFKDAQLKSSTLLSETDYIKNTISADKYAKLKANANGDVINFTTEQVKSIVKYFGLNSSAKRDENLIKFTIKDQKLNIKFEGASENTLEAEFDLAVKATNRTFNMGIVFIEVLSAVNNGLTMQIGENLVSIEVKDENLEFNFIVGQTA